MSQINQCCVHVLLPMNLQDCNELIHLFILTAVALLIYHHHRVISPSFSFSSSTSAISSSFSSAFSCSSLKPDRFCQSPTYGKEFHILNHKVSLEFFFDTTSPPMAVCLPQKIEFWWWWWWWWWWSPREKFWTPRGNFPLPWKMKVVKDIYRTVVKQHIFQHLSAVSP